MDIFSSKNGAHICKIVTGADTMKLKIINMLKENMKIPFLFLCGGEGSIFFIGYYLQKSFGCLPVILKKAL